MLEILRVNLLGLDDDQRLFEGGVEQVLHRLWRAAAALRALARRHELASLNGGTHPRARHAPSRASPTAR